MPSENEGMTRLDDDIPGAPRGVVERVAEKVARREFLRRTGRFALGGTIAGWIVGVPRAMATCVRATGDCTGATICQGKTCVWWQNGFTCAKRVGDCCSGGQCWTENHLSCCDWYGQNGACSCCVTV